MPILDALMVSDEAVRLISLLAVVVILTIYLKLSGDRDS
jgi:hypothetical protein